MRFFYEVFYEGGFFMVLYKLTSELRFRYALIGAGIVILLLYVQ
jgi:hypothetical protein